jgi:hypothetical protein
LRRIRGPRDLPGIHDLKEGLSRTHGESQPLLEIRHASKCDAVMLRDLYQVMIGREDADPAREPAQIPSGSSIAMKIQDVDRVQGESRNSSATLEHLARIPQRSGPIECLACAGRQRIVH